jgi:hypothetical protein
MPEITVELIQARRQVLENSRVKLLADLNATIGAIMDCDHWLETLTKEESQENKP